MKKITLGAMLRVEERAGRKFSDVFDAASEGSMTDMALLLWARQLSENPDTSFEDAVSEVDREGLEKYIEDLTAALNQ